MTKQDLVDRAVQEHIDRLNTAIESYKYCTQPGNRSDLRNEARIAERDAYVHLRGGYTRKAKAEMDRASWLRKSAEKYGP